MADLIDRQAAITIPVTPKEDREYQTFNLDDAYEQGWYDLQKCIELLPSAQPERKKGKFIGTEYDGYADGNPVYYEWKCSECGCIFEDEEPTYNYCPNCGCRMMEVER